MAKEIWLPDSKTHVHIENGKVQVWDTMIMTPRSLTKKSYGFYEEDKDDDKTRTDV
jgi:hypothetical protein